MIGTHPLGRSALGPSLPHRAGAIDTVLPATGTPPQEGHRLGSPDDPATAPLLPNRSLVIVGDNGYAVLDLLHCCQSLREPVADHQTAPGCWPLRSGSTSTTGSKRPAPSEGITSAHPQRTPPCPRPAVANRVGVLVRRHHPNPGTRLPDRRLVSPWQTSRTHPLGIDPRPPR